MLYDKIYNMIEVSSDGTEPTEGDGDRRAYEILASAQTNIVSAGQVSEPCQVVVVDEAIGNSEEVKISTNEIEIVEGVSQIPTTSASQSSVLNLRNDWSNHTPSMLRSRKHKVLTKKKDEEERSSKQDMNDLKMELLRSEQQRDIEAHNQKMCNEMEVHSIRIRREENELEHLKIMRKMEEEKLSLEIALLKKQLNKN